MSEIKKSAQYQRKVPDYFQAGDFLAISNGLSAHGGFSDDQCSVNHDSNSTHNAVFFTF
jgi:hypothetical protein